MSSTKNTPSSAAVTGHVLSLVIVLLVGCLSVATTRADAHTPKPIACVHAWRDAAPGDKWEELQACKQAQRNHKVRHLCSGDRPLVPTSTTVKGVRVNAHQRRVLTTLLNMGRNRDASGKVQVSAVATTTQEARATELAGGHGTSVGPFQLIDLHGSAERRRTIEFSGDWYLDRAVNVAKHKPWLSIAEVSHAVQRSAHPTAVARWVPEARLTYRRFLGPCPR